MLWILVGASIVSFSADMMAKGLVITDAYLGYFVSVTPAGTTNICGTIWTTYNAELTACGQSFIQYSVMEMVKQLSYIGQDMGGMVNILLGVFAI